MRPTHRALAILAALAFAFLARPGVLLAQNALFRPASPAAVEGPPSSTRQPILGLPFLPRFGPALVTGLRFDPIPPTEDAGRLGPEAPVPIAPLPVKGEAKVLVSVGFSVMGWQRIVERDPWTPYLGWCLHGGTAGHANAQMETEEATAHEAIQDFADGLLGRRRLARLTVFLFAVEDVTLAKLGDSRSYRYDRTRQVLEIVPMGRPTNRRITSTMIRHELRAVYASGHGEPGGIYLDDIRRPVEQLKESHVAIARKGKPPLDHLIIHACYSGAPPYGSRWANAFRVSAGGTKAWLGAVTGPEALAWQTGFTYGKAEALP